MNYIRRHWRGDLPLWTAFWVNMALVNLLIILVDFYFQHGQIDIHPRAGSRIYLAYWILVVGILYPWQLIGTWRSASGHVRQTGRRFWARTTQALLVLGVIGTVANIQGSMPVYEDLFTIAFRPDPYADYEINQVNDKTMQFAGSVGFGAARDFRRALLNHPDTERVILNSSGGRLYEARQIAEMIRRKSLDTYSTRGCYSACTVPFISGQRRFLGPNANLAFHQYGNDLNSASDPVNRMEEARDTDLYRSQGVGEAFLQRMFSATEDDLWYPTHPELLEAGVIHGITNAGNLDTGYRITGSPGAIQKALEEIPLMKTIKENDPALYQALITEVRELPSGKASGAAISGIVKDYIQRAAGERLYRTNNDALFEFIDATVYAMRSLKDIKPILCVKMLYPEQYGSLNIADTLENDAPARMLASMERIIEDTASPPSPPPVDTHTARQTLRDIIDTMGDDTAYLGGRRLKNREDYTRACNAAIEYYELMRARPTAEAGNVLRYSLSAP